MIYCPEKDDVCPDEHLLVQSRINGFNEVPGVNDEVMDWFTALSAWTRTYWDKW